MISVHSLLVFAHDRLLLVWTAIVKTNVLIGFGCREQWQPVLTRQCGS